MEPSAPERTFFSVMAETDDEHDWTSALSGDGEAFGRIFDRHRRRILNHSFAITRSSNDADDVLSITFLEAWRRAHAIRFVDGSMLPWLLVTATNSARNLSRSARRYRAMIGRLPIDSHDDERLFRAIDSETLDAFRRLSLADQRILTLCVMEGFSEKDAAAALGVPAGTVKSRLSRAKARLAASLTPLTNTREVPNEQ
jgi:RNA polymerase sigma-70 factor (ECF subfamily)